MLERGGGESIHKLRVRYSDFCLHLLITSFSKGKL